MTDTPARGQNTHSGFGRGVVSYLGQDLHRTGLVGAIVTVAIVGTVTSPYFLVANNLLNVARQATVVAILGLAVTAALIVGIVDFSVGATLALSSVVIGLTGNGPVVVTIGWLVLIAVALTAVKAALLAYGRMESLITTLGLALALDGFAFAASGQGLVPVSSAGWRYLGNASLLGVPVAVLLLVTVTAVFSLLFRRTVLGREMFAVGNNEEAAEIAGVRTARVKTWALFAATTLAMIAAVVFAGRIAAGDPAVGTGQTLDAVVVAVLGGASLFGGRGSVLGLMMAAILMALFFNVFNLLNLAIYWQMIARGTILVGAVSLDVFRRR